MTWIRGLLALAWTLFTLFLMWTPSIPLPKTFLGDLTDKAGHLALFCVLALVWCWLINDYVPRRQAFRITLVVTILFGGCTELGQSLVPGRDVAFFDFVANALGAALGSTLMLWATARRAAADYSPAEKPL
jgi:VanZ family protein